MSRRIPFAPFATKPWLRRPASGSFGGGYESVAITDSIPTWVRYNPSGQYWEYTINKIDFYRLPENPLVPSDIQFKNIGSAILPNPPSGEGKLFVRSSLGIPQLCMLWDNGEIDVITSGPATGFPTGAVAGWKLNEATGATRNDSIGTAHLTDNSSVTLLPAAKVGGGATFDGTSWLSRADDAALSMGAGVSCEWAGWVRFNNLTNSMGIFGKWVATQEYVLLYNNVTLRFHWHGSTTGANNVSVQSSSFGSPLTGVWYFFDVYYDVSSGDLGISINRGTFDTAFIGTAGLFDSTVVFNLGAYNNGVSLLNGDVDAVYMWKRLLTTEERNILYNSGAGLEL